MNKALVRRGSSNGRSSEPSESSESPSLIDVAKSAAHDLFELVTAQIKLARVELAGDIRLTLTRAGRIAVFIPPVLLSYVFGMAALASWLARYWGLPGALGAVALLNCGIGVGGVLWSLAALRRLHPMQHTASGAAETVERVVKATSSERSPDA
jgi:hypothetical protein